MKEQRWHDDYETVPQEFSHSRMEEQMGMMGQNRDHLHDYLAAPEPYSTPYQIEELEPSWTTQLDTVGMQPHSREYLERNVTNMRSSRRYEMIAGQMIDYCPGIQFSGRP
jgi:hypothetical protein